MPTASPTPSGAHDLFGGPCVVVDLGTATTFDAISAAGEYLGGAITPGVAISLDALFAHAAALGRVELVEPRSVIGKSTVESIQSGALYGFAGQVDGLCRRFAAVLGRVHGGGHRRPVRAHLPLFRGDRVRGALAHPPRPQAHLRAQRALVLLRGRAAAGARAIGPRHRLPGRLLAHGRPPATVGVPGTFWSGMTRCPFFRIGILIGVQPMDIVDADG